MGINKAASSLFKLSPSSELNVFTFHLPEIEDDEKTIEMSALQLKRVIALTALIIARGCRFEQVIMPVDKPRPDTITFVINQGDTEALKKELDELLGEHTEEDEDIDSYDSTE